MRLRTIFAWLPTKTRGGVWVWLEGCWRYERSGPEYVYYDYYTLDDDLSNIQHLSDKQSED
jgi:hypothetical protein